MRVVFDERLDCEEFDSEAVCSTTCEDGNMIFVNEHMWYGHDGLTCSTFCEEYLGRGCQSAEEFNNNDCGAAFVRKWECDDVMLDQEHQVSTHRAHVTPQGTHCACSNRHLHAAREHLCDYR